MSYMNLLQEEKRQFSFGFVLHGLEEGKHRNS